MITSRPILPNEHGAWAILLVPLLVGAQVGGGFGWLGLFFTISSLAVFLSYIPARTLLRHLLGHAASADKVKAARRWLGIYLFVAAAFGLPLLLSAGRWLLLPIGVLGLCCFLLSFVVSQNRQKTIGSDLVAVVGLTLTAAGAYYVTSGNFDGTALVLWLLNSLFFGSSAFFGFKSLA